MLRGDKFIKSTSSLHTTLEPVTPHTFLLTLLTQLSLLSRTSKVPNLRYEGPTLYPRDFFSELMSCFDGGFGGGGRPPQTSKTLVSSLYSWAVS